MKAPLTENKTFKVELNTADHKCLASTTKEDKNWLWHHKYGHLNFKSLCMLNQKKIGVWVAVCKGTRSGM